MILAGVSCSRPAGPLHLTLDESGARVTGLSSKELDDLRAANLSTEAWSRVLLVCVSGSDVAIAGRHVVDAGELRFSPLFPFDAGRTYVARFDPARLPVPRVAGELTAAFSRPGPDPRPTTSVTQIFPAADVWPENILRMYVQFSGPMTRGSGAGFVRLLDAKGDEVPDAFLPVEADFWSPDHTRYTVFFDPGRVKSGILPNQQMGRALQPGRKFAIEVSADWRDASGRPLKTDYRREFTAGPAEVEPIDVGTWNVTSPKPATLEPLVVRFPNALDHALALRALSVVNQSGAVVAGDVAMAHGDVSWSLTPAQAWAAGAYRLVAASILEDVAGNQLGRAFEVAMQDKPGARQPAENAAVAFIVR